MKATSIVMAASLIALAGVAAVPSVSAHHGEPGYSLVECLRDLVPGTDFCGESTLQAELHDCEPFLEAPLSDGWNAECANTEP